MWSVCLGLIFDPRHLPLTFDRGLDAEGIWAILRNSPMSDRVTLAFDPRVIIRGTQHANLDLQLLTINRDHNWGVDVLHDLLWGSEQS